jgi:hypothetical protein
VTSEAHYDDGHLALLVHIVEGIKTTTARAEWVSKNLPLTSAHMLDGFNWEAASALSMDGSGNLPRGSTSVYPYRAKMCADCGQSFKPRSGRQWFCTACGVRRAGERSKHLMAMPVRAYRGRSCVVCGRPFTGCTASQITCSRPCQRARNHFTHKRWWQRTGTAAQRARRVQGAPCHDHVFIVMPATELNTLRGAAGWSRCYTQLSARQSYTACDTCLHIKHTLPSLHPRQATARQPRHHRRGTVGGMSRKEAGGQVAPTPSERPEAAHAHGHGSGGTEAMRRPMVAA